MKVGGEKQEGHSQKAWEGGGGLHHMRGKGLTLMEIFIRVYKAMPAGGGITGL